MDFLSTILFLTFYYVRPQEIFDFLNSFHPITLTLAIGIIGIATREPRIQFKDFFKTPHDWAMYLLIGWIVYASPTPGVTWDEVKAYLIYYLVITHALTSIKRIKVFLLWWTWLIMLLAAVAVASLYGIDPLGNQDWTNANDGRLCVDLTIFRNPNALGHNIVPGVLLAYFAFMWGRPIFMQQLGVFILALPLWCIYFTYSKGAFVSTFVSGTLSYVFGRPLVVQVLVVWLAVTFGWAAVFQLPRMGQLQRTRGDPGIVQRVELWRHGLLVLKYREHGVGYMNWWASMYETHGWVKAPHCTYVQVGAELGYKGLLLYLAVIYMCLRTLVTVRTGNKEEERVRRMLFVLVVSYAFSSWMIDFGYRPTYFMFAAAVAAFHRLVHFRGEFAPVPEKEQAVASTLKPVSPEGVPLPVPGLPVLMAASEEKAATPPLLPAPAGPASEDEKETPTEAGVRWNRIGIIDCALVWAMTWTTIRFWTYAIQNM
jgi:hypothetical protein